MTSHAVPAVDPSVLREVLDGRWGEVREAVRSFLRTPSFAPVHGLDMEAHRERVTGQARQLAESGNAALGFPQRYGGQGDVGGSITAFEMLAFADPSLQVKVGVQWGLFAGAVLHLGTERHHEQVLSRILAFEVPGCFAMTETGHGSDVQAIRTTATYEPETDTFVITTPEPSARKDYIGNAARDGRMAAVFAQLVTNGQGHGVHAFLVPLRDDQGRPCPGVQIEDCGPKAGLGGVDNGRLTFTDVRVPRDALLNRYGDVARDGTYTSPIDNENKRFFTMLGTLVQGRISVSGGAGAVARLALTIAVRYGEKRRQFRPPGGDDEVVILDYLAHQRRLLPALARAYALAFAQNEVVSTLHDLVGGAGEGRDRRELETRAAGLKAVATWHATATIQTCREACGGAGYMSENLLPGLKADSDVFTTFEGDNTVLMQLVAKGLLTDYASDFEDLDQLGMVRFVAGLGVETVLEKAGVHKLLERIKDVLPGGDDWDQEAGLLDPEYQLAMYRFREEHMLGGVARRLKRGIDDGMNPGAVFSRAQDHVIGAARAHVERLVLEAFVEKTRALPDGDLKVALNLLCDLHALSGIEADRAWFMEHGRLTATRSKAITREVADLCRKIRPICGELVDAFGIPVEMLRAPDLVGRT